MSQREPRITPQALSDSVSFVPTLAIPVAPSTQSASSYKDRCRKAGIALIDEFPLRRESTLNLLRAHIRVRARPFGGAAEFLKQIPTNVDAHCGVIMCVGGRSMLEAPIPEQLRHLSHAIGSTPVIVLSDREESEEVAAAFREGARGYIPTSLEPCLVIAAILMVLAGGAFVPAGALMGSPRKVQPETQIERPPCPEEVPVEHQERWPPRQLAVLHLLVQGKANKEIAHALTIEESTVKVHVRHITRKLGVTNRTQAALSARRLGIGAPLDGALASVVSGQDLVSCPNPAATTQRREAAGSWVVKRLADLRPDHQASGLFAVAPGGADHGAPHR
jgi:DNA-binding NarL/FixJ family response regulator